VYISFLLVDTQINHVLPFGLPLFFAIFKAVGPMSYRKMQGLSSPEDPTGNITSAGESIVPSCFRKLMNMKRRESGKR